MTLIGHRGILRVHGILDKPDQLVFFDQHRFGVCADMEADLIQGDKVGGVGNGDEQAIAALEQRQGVVGANQFFIDQLGDSVIKFKAIEIEDRYTEFLRGSHCQRQRADHLLFNNIGDKLHFIFKRTHGGLDGILLR